MITSIYLITPSLYEHSGSNLLRFILLILLEKIFFYSEAKLIEQLFSKMPVIPFLVSLLQEKDVMTVTMCLFMFDALSEKMNNKETIFTREGVLEILKELAFEDACTNLKFYST